MDCCEFGRQRAKQKAAQCGSLSVTDSLAVTDQLGERPFQGCKVDARRSNRSVRISVQSGSGRTVGRTSVVHAKRHDSSSQHSPGSEEG